MLVFVVKKPITKEHRRVVNRSPKVTQPTRLLHREISKVGDYVAHLKSYYFY